MPQILAMVLSPDTCPDGRTRLESVQSFALPLIGEALWGTLTTVTLIASSGCGSEECGIREGCALAEMRWPGRT